jgi:hypothetical protein
MMTVLIVLGVLLARRRSQAMSVALSAIVGLILPVLGLLSTYSGAILGLAGLFSLGWLVTPRWYGRPRRLDVKARNNSELENQQPLLDASDADNFDPDVLTDDVSTPPRPEAGT